MSILKKIGWVILFAFVVLVLYRGVGMWEAKRTEAEVARIHATKLTLADVTGENLPPLPAEVLVMAGNVNPSEADIRAYYDTTVAGVDVNENGIRDDVELAIFERYPDSARTRAVLLQYALALQMERQPRINSGIVGEIANMQDRAFFCISEIHESGSEGLGFDLVFGEDVYLSFIFEEQFNTEARKKTHDDFYSKLKSGRIDDSIPCDIELSLLPN